MEEFVLDFFKDHGLWALFLLMLADNIGVPFPSEVPLLFAGYLVSRGDMSYAGASAVGAAGSVAGALILYTAGRTIGRAVVERWGRVIRVTEQDLIRAERWFHRKGEATVFFLRVVPLARTLISIPAGMLEMSPVRFGAYTLAGSAIWTMVVVGIGWGLGANYERVLDQFGLASIVAASTILMVLVIVVGRRMLTKRAREEQAPTEPR